MTKQEYYDLLIRSASDGTFPGGGSDGCFYRAGSWASCKVRCAVGLLIPDHEYDLKIEGKMVVGMGDAARSCIKLPEGMSFDDLHYIQVAHDWLVDNWDANKFISRINVEPCFQDVQRVEV